MDEIICRYTKSAHKIIKLRVMCVCTKFGRTRYMYCDEHTSAKTLDANYTWESALPQFICEISFFFSTSLFYRRLWHENAMDGPNGIEGREKKKQHKLYMRIQSQTTHLNTYTWNANVVFIVIGRTPHIFSPYMKKWVVVSLFSFIFFHLFILLIFSHFSSLSIHFAYIHNTVCKSTER